MDHFNKDYPDFAAIEAHIRRAHAERSVAMATTVANAILRAVNGVARFFGPKPALRAANGAVIAKAQVASQPARV